MQKKELDIKIVSDGPGYVRLLTYRVSTGPAIQRDGLQYVFAKTLINSVRMKETLVKISPYPLSPPMMLNQEHIDFIGQEHITPGCLKPYNSAIARHVGVLSALGPPDLSEPPPFHFETMLVPPPIASLVVTFGSGPVPSGGYKSDLTGYILRQAAELRFQKEQKDKKE